jgi:predicted small lipoprotein YifL
MTRRPLLLLGVALALAGCGARRDLRPAPGEKVTPVPYGDTTRPTPAQLMTPSTQQRPTRSDELLRESTERPDDPFDMPPRN